MTGVAILMNAANLLNASNGVAILELTTAANLP
jgi:hypothetical protein